MEKKKLKVGMIGVGDITFLHYNAYKEFEYAELYKICDINEEQLKKRSKEWGITNITTDYKQIIYDPKIDIVEVNTPHHLHKKFVVEALEAGKNVSCQKPISTTISDAEAMIKAESTSRGKLRILENFIFYPPYVVANELIKSGEIGELLSIRFKLGSSMMGATRRMSLATNLWHLMESEKGMGWAVFDDGYHKLSMAIHLVGNIDSVKGFIDRSFKYIDEPAQLIWRYKEKDVLGSFDIALSPNLYIKSKYFPVDERIDIIGTKGIIKLTCCTGRLFDEAPLILYKDGKRYLFDNIETDWQASFSDGIRDFPIAILEGRDTLISAKRATDILKFAYALIIASKKEIEVRPDDITDDIIQRELLNQ